MNVNARRAAIIDGLPLGVQDPPLSHFADPLVEERHQQPGTGHNGLDLQVVQTIARGPLQLFGGEGPHARQQGSFDALEQLRVPKLLANPEGTGMVDHPHGPVRGPDGVA
jgi:hypothetical protein